MCTSASAFWDSPPDWLRHRSGAISSRCCQSKSVSQSRGGWGPNRDSMSEWTYKVVTRLHRPYSKQLAVGARTRREGPGAPKRNQRRGGYGLLSAKPLHRAGSSASSAPQSASSFSFKPDSQAPSAGPISSFPTASGFANKPAIGFSNAVTGPAASFTFAGTTASDGASSGFNNAKAVSASTFSFAPTTSSGAGASAFSGFGAATTALPASTPSPITGAFGGTTVAIGFAQNTTSGFGGPAASGFGQSTTSGFGGPTASGFGQSTTSSFGGPAASGFGQSNTSGFGGTTGSSGFGQSATSGFGGGPSTSGFGGLAANTVTSGFGAKTSAVSDLFKAGAASSATTSIFGQASGVSVSRPPSVSSTSEASSTNPVFTPRSELSEKEILQFESKRFSLGNIPLRPPPADLLKRG